MNRYPLWKYATILVALVIGLIYTLPNFFGESPAVQVSSAKATLKLESAVDPRIEQELAGLRDDQKKLEEILGSPAALRRLMIREIESDAKNFADADAIRQQLFEEGVILEDKPGGQTSWRRA